MKIIDFWGISIKGVERVIILKMEILGLMLFLI